MIKKRVKNVSKTIKRCGNIKSDSFGISVSCDLSKGHNGVHKTNTTPPFIWGKE